MDFKAILTNPLVIIGGVGIGLILLMSGKGNTTQNTNAPDYGATLQSISLNNDISKAGMQLLAVQAKIAGDVAISQSEQNTALYVSTLSTMANLKNAASLRYAQIAESNSGIFNSMIRDRTQLAIERQRGATAISMLKIEGSQNLEAMRIESGVSTKTAATKSSDSSIISYGG